MRAFTSEECRGGAIPYPVDSHGDANGCDSHRFGGGRLAAVRITIVIAGLRGGGAERVAVNLANGWVGRGWRPTILTLAQKEEPVAYALAPGVVHTDITRRRFAREVKPGLADTIDDVMAFCPPPVRALLVPLTVEVALLREAIEATAPDAILSFIDLTNLKTIAATRRLDVPLFVYEQVDPRRTSVGEWELPRRVLYPHATRVVALTESDAACFRERGAKAVAIANPVLAAPAGEGVREPLNAPMIMGAGRLVPQKDFGRLLHAFANVATKHPRWRLEIWGQGPQLGRLTALTAELGLSERVTFPGFADDIYQPLRRASLFALSSTYEGFPNALCEAMAAGVPAVAYDSASGIGEIIRDGIDGVVIRGTRSVGSFSDVLDRLMGDEAERQRLATRAPEVATRFSLDSILARWDALFAETGARAAA
jgi:GalNAc-alpha-(1->4)-GalNAc-alpha-(1->3)-diNAcBac-PP-undecaprenol alpha-1,4-N-acetyl-D-galactosaminyltransferase